MKLTPFLLQNFEQTLRETLEVRESGVVSLYLDEHDTRGINKDHHYPLTFYTISRDEHVTHAFKTREIAKAIFLGL